MRLQEVAALRHYHRRRRDQERRLAAHHGHPKAAERHRELHHLHEMMLGDLDTDFVHFCHADKTGTPVADGHRPMRIVLVEDSAMIEAIVRMSLPAANDVDLLCCSSVRQTVETLTASYRRIDAILLDMVLGDGDGLDVIRQVRSHTTAPDIPIILFTATSSERDIAEYLAAGAIGVIRKPFDPLGLHGRITQMLDEFANRTAPVTE